jgi:hypothetical protein
VRIRRFPGRDVPADRDARIAWLYERWQEVDDWIDGGRRRRR